MAPKVKAADNRVLEETGMLFETPPENSTTRKSKHDDLYGKAISLAKQYPGQFLRVMTYNNPSQPYNLAKAINNEERAEFTGHEGGKFEAVGRKIPAQPATEDSEATEEAFGIWIKFVEDE
jgi:hypothetical protein